MPSVAAKLKRAKLRAKTPGDHQISVTVIIKVAGHNDVSASGGVYRVRSKATVAISQKHADVIAADVLDGEIQPAVVIEIADDNAAGVGVDRERVLALEGAVPLP